MWLPRPVSWTRTRTLRGSCAHDGCSWWDRVVVSERGVVVVPVPVLSSLEWWMDVGNSTELQWNDERSFQLRRRLATFDGKSYVRIYLSSKCHLWISWTAAKTGERLSNRRGIRTIPSILLSNRSPVAAALKGLPAVGN